MLRTQKIIHAAREKSNADGGPGSLTSAMTSAKGSRNSSSFDARAAHPAVSDAVAWTKKQVSTSDRAWHTKVIASGGDYLMVGQSFARLAKTSDPRRN